MDRENKQKLKPKIKSSRNKTAGAGIIFTALARLTGSVYKAVSGSFIGRALKSGDWFHAALSRSYILGGLKSLRDKLGESFRRQPQKTLGTEELGPDVGIYNENTLSVPVKMRISRAISTSVVLRGIKNIFSRIMCLPVMTAGLVLLSFGISTMVVQAVRLFSTDNPVEIIITLAQGIVILLFSIPALTNRDDTIYRCLASSRLGHLIVFSVMGAEEKEPTPGNRAGHTGIIMYILGVIAGLLTFFISPVAVIASFITVVFAVRIMFVPEFGVLFMLIILPFMSVSDRAADLCLYAVIYISVCFFLKVLAGRRCAEFRFTDFLAALLALVAFSCSRGSTNPAEASHGALILFAFILAYYAVRNLIRSAKWCERCFTAFMLSSFAVSVTAIIKVFTEDSLNNSSVFETGEELAVYISAAFVITLSRFIASGGHKPAIFILMITQLAALFVSGAVLPALLLAVTVLVFLIIYSQKTFPVLILLLVFIPVVICFLDPEILSGLSWLFDPARLGDSYRIRVWRVSLDLAADRAFCGTGIGSGIFSEAFSAYSSSAGLGSTSAMSVFIQLTVQLGITGLLIFLAIITTLTVNTFTVYSKNGPRSRYAVYNMGLYMSVMYLLLAGLFYSVFDNPVLMLVFWMITGLSFSCGRYTEDESRKSVDVMSEMSCDISVALPEGTRGHTGGRA